MLVALLLLLCVPLGAPLSYDTIVQGAKKCCRQDPETQSCCVRKLLNDSARLGCPTPEWHFIGACLEKFFWNTTFIAQHAYQCCALLHSPQCRRECSYTFRAPGLSPEVRRRFSPETSCQDPASLADDCRKGSLLRRHECFRPCLQLRLSNPPIFFFDPLRHCPHMDPATMNGCVGPANLMDVY